MKVKCKVCGWVGDWEELPVRTIREDYGDVCCAICPKCGLPEETKGNLFEEVEGE